MVRERIQEAADELESDYIQTLKELVRISRVAGFESHARELVEDLHLSGRLNGIKIYFECVYNDVLVEPLETVRQI